MKHIANALAREGRGPDTELLHVTKDEINHLNNVARSRGLGSLTRNPKTGLLEAGLFQTILPIVGGVVGGIYGASVGAPSLGAAAGAALGTGLAGGTSQQMLTSGLVSGVTAGLMPGSEATEAGLSQSAAPIAENVVATPVQTEAAAATTTGSNQAAQQAAEQQAAEQQAAEQQAAATGNPYEASPSTSWARTDPAGAQNAGMHGTNMSGETSPSGYDLYDTNQDFSAGASPSTGVDSSWARSGPTEAPTVLNKAGNWVTDNPGKTAYGGYLAAKAMEPQPDMMPQKHRQEMKGQARSNRTYTGGIGQTGPGEKSYFANNSPYSFTQDPSTYEMRYAEGGQVNGGAGIFNTPLMPEHQRQFADGGVTTAAPAPQEGGIAALPQATGQGYIHSQTEVPAGVDVGYAHSQTGAPDQGYIHQNYSASPAAGYANTYQPGVNVQQQANQIQATMPAAPAGIAAIQDPTKTNVAKRGWLEQMQFDAPSSFEERETEYQKRMDQWNNDKAGHDSNTSYSVAAPTRATRPSQYAKGGLLNLRKHGSAMDPTFLKGAGDGMSDSIPAQIQGSRQRANEPIRVADGEYIVPADAVAHAGNGSSNAGSKKMDKMVADLRSARTGTKKQAPQINAAKYIPK